MQSDRTDALAACERIVMAADAVLDSNCGVKAIADLAAALRDAGCADYTAEYPDPDLVEREA